MTHWQVGDVHISKFVEREVTGYVNTLLPDATPEACKHIEWLQPDVVTEDGKLHSLTRAGATTNDGPENR